MRIRFSLVLLVTTLGAACVQAPAASPLDELMRAEDRRGVADDDLRALREATGSADNTIRRTAVRGLGRLEHADLLADILPLLDDVDASVRAAAATAVAQALSRGAGRAGFEPLRVVTTTDTDVAVAGAAATSIGRLRYDDNGAAVAAEAALVGFATQQLTATADLSEPTEGLLGAARGLESLFRLRRDHTPRPETLALLHGLAERRRAQAEDEASARVRFLAVSALVSADAELSDENLFALQRDPNVGVRRIAAGVIGSSRDYGSLLVARALQDPEARVRYSLLSALSRRTPERGACSRLLAGLRDGDAAVRLLTIDALADCEGASATLDRIAGDIQASTASDWQAPVHALLSLASMDPTGARPHADSASGHPVWQVRMYAARAAASAGWIDLLRRLAADEHANVASAAIPGLSAHAGHAGDDLYLDALGRDDPQLLMAAAAALVSDSPADREVPQLADGTAAGTSELRINALIAALNRVTALQRETSRDARRALLEAVGTIGSAGRADAIAPYLRDFDSAIAAAASDVLERWTDVRLTTLPQPLPPSPFPGVAELAEIEATQAVMRMQDGGEVMLRLFPFESPSNTARFVRLARQGYLDGLTFHRVVPNFVIQGGSPGANEYAGDGPFTRDEITARSHLRGTVGISTRGRDTGDAQIFVNLIDNVRLDFNYTIIGEVIEGMDVVDGVVEGAVIDSVRFEAARFEPGTAQ